MSDITPQKIEDWVENSMHYGMTDEQIKNFVTNSHVTDFRKLRQCHEEKELRNNEGKKNELDLKGKEIRIRKLKEH